MHYIDTYLDNGQILTKNQNSLGIGHKKLGISTQKDRGGGSREKKIHKKVKSQTH